MGLFISQPLGQGATLFHNSGGCESFAPAKTSFFSIEDFPDKYWPDSFRLSLVPLISIVFMSFGLFSPLISRPRVFNEKPELCFGTKFDLSYIKKRGKL